MNVAALQMGGALRAKDVVASRNTCVTHIKTVIDNRGIGVPPQKLGGCALPPAMEKKFAANVKALMSMKFSVFPDEVMKWAAEEIAGTLDADMFENRYHGRGWYRGWLSRMEFQVGPMQFLELIRDVWNTGKKMAESFEVATDVLLDAGVAIVNPDYDPNEAYSQEILITHPERTS